MTGARIFFYIFSLLIFGFVLYYFSEIRQEFRLLKKVNNYWLLLALFLQLLTYFLNAIIYQLLLRTYKLSQILSLKELYKASVISLFFNQTIPSAGISGNAFLFNYLQKKKISPSLIFSLILTELLTFYAAIEAIIILFLLRSFVHEPPSVFYGILIGGLLVYLLFGIIVILTGRKKSFDFLYKKFLKLKLFKRFFQRISSSVPGKDLDVHSIELFSLVKNQKLALGKAFFFQLLLFTADVCTISALFYGLGQQASFLLISLSLISTKVISVLPFSPGSLILYESSMTFFFVTLGIPLGPSVMVTLIYRLLSFWLPIPAGLVLYRQWLHKQSSGH